MGRPGPRVRQLSQEKERLEQLLRNAWLFGEDELEAAAPGDEGRLASLLGGPFENPLAPRDIQDVENPHVHLLRVMRNPGWFPFTCKHVFNVTLLPFQHVILKELWNRTFPMLIGTRGLGKSFLLALYSMLRALIFQGTKVVVVGAAFRQAKVVFEYCEAIWANAPVLRDLCGGGKGRGNREQGPRRDIDRCEMILGESIILCLPLGNGEKIRGQRANVIVAEEFGSLPPEIYEVVIQGFGAVSQDPVGNVRDRASRRLGEKLGYRAGGGGEGGVGMGRGNQSIISGTADYSFKHFCRYWERYKAIVQSRGDREKLAALCPDGVYDGSINWRDYSVIRVPVNLLPPGFMDEKIVGRSKMTVHSAIYAMEYGAVFPRDSDGFFKRSLIEMCVAGGPQCSLPHRFTASLRGDPGVKHVIAVDPAAVSDNLCIVVLALHPDHRRVVYCWTVRKKEFLHRQKMGDTKDKNYYYFVARKIRDVMKLFPCVRLVMDAQGGGLAVEEALHDDDKIGEGEAPIWQVIDPDPKNRKDSDGRKGEHVLELVEFARADWVCEANDGLKKDMEDKTLLFPYLDVPLLGLAVEEDKQLNRQFDTFDDCCMEIEALKDELTTIVHTQTASGRDRWDVPAVKAPGSKPGRLRKDRYSALLMANMAARQMARKPARLEHHAAGGWAAQLRKGAREEAPMYVLGDGWMTGAHDVHGTVVRRGSGV